MIVEANPTSGSDPNHTHLCGEAEVETFSGAGDGGQQEKQHDQQQWLGQSAYDLPHHDAHRPDPPRGGYPRMNLSARFGLYGPKTKLGTPLLFR